MKHIDDINEGECTFERNRFYTCNEPKFLKHLLLSTDKNHLNA